MDEHLPSLEAIQALHQERTSAVLEGRLTSVEQGNSQVRAALDAVVQRLGGANLKRRSQHEELWALCPFHVDINVGSFSVNMTTGFYYCFVCGAMGGLVALLTKLGLWTPSMREALKGVDLEALVRAARQRRNVLELEDMHPLPESLLSPIRHLRPRRYVSKGHPRHIIDAAELCYDPDRRRIVFPVRSGSGDLVGMQTRLAYTHDRGIRWQWYSDELYDMASTLEDAEVVEDYRPPRSTVLYGEHTVFTSMASGQIHTVVLVEGMGGWLRTVAAGYSCLASFGTRLAPAQVRRMAHVFEWYSDSTGQLPTVICAHDGDAPGRAAAVEAILHLGGSCNALIAPVPRGKDPEDLTPNRLRRVLQSATGLTEGLQSPGRFALELQRALMALIPMRSIRNTKGPRVRRRGGLG